MKIYIKYLILVSLSFNAYSERWEIGPSDSSQDEIQEALILAEPGDTVYLKEGIYNLRHGLSLDVNDIVIQGSGMNKTILDFSDQKTGAQGLIVTSDNVVLKDFAVENAKGDAIKSKGVKNISFLRIRTEWTNGPDSKNGAYGLYPVESIGVLIDECVAIGASDAGVYVGQSEQIIVRNTRAEFNVAGIEIENSYHADVYNNIATNNTGGILIFDLPNLPKQGGKNVRVFQNKSFKNNTENFAPEGNIVGEVPKGTGLIIMANRNVEIFDNDFYDNETVHIAVVAGDLESGDDNYDPYPKSINIHHNRYSNVGSEPDSSRGDLGPILVDIAGTNMPDIIWDGLLPFTQLIFGQPETEKLVLKELDETKFLNLDVFWYVAFPFFHSSSRDKSLFNGSLENLPAIEEWK
ncbi:right-handed parallel beta-helix repeat-containing protein [SAR86 cluster bacterium]|jgi:parallel beta-helix repeat protein|nr:right-handed parallel beta-helix repeat-containing protein [SAR86 cluster bacterium]